MATPKKPRNYTTKVKSTRVEKERPSSGKTIAAVFAALITLVAVGYFVLGVNPFSSDEGSTSEDVKVETADEQKPEVADDSSEREDVVRDLLERARTGESVDTVAKESEQAYEYIAGTGEAFSMLARSAISKADAGLTNAERIAAETRLTQDSGAQYLDIGQQLSLQKDDVKAAIDWAKALSAEEKSAWQYYADMVAW